MSAGRGVVALAAGACVAASVGGAGASLTAIPPPVLLSCGVVMAAVCRRAPAFDWPCFCCGLALGAALPRDAPPPDGRVIERAPYAAVQSDLFDALEQLDRDPASLMHRRIRVTGLWTPSTSARAATVSRRVMTCCAADAFSVGFDVEPARSTRVPAGVPVRADGVVEESMRDGELRYVLEQCRITRLEELR